MRTKCPDEAERRVRATMTKLDELERNLDSLSYRFQNFSTLSEADKIKFDKELKKQVSKLPPDQKALLQKGGVWNAADEMKSYADAAAFVEAGFGGEYDLKDLLGEAYHPDKREQVEDDELATIKRFRRKASEYRTALTSARVVEPCPKAATGLHDILEIYCETKGYQHGEFRNQTREQHEYAVRRFTEFHEDIPVSNLQLKHLSEFSKEYLKLPVSSRKDVRPLRFRDAVRIAEREGLPRVSERTRSQNLTLLKSLMAFAVREGYRDAPDPWERYSPTGAKQKVSKQKKEKPHSFSTEEVKTIVVTTSQKFGKTIIDHWAPIFGAYYGMRLEEICQVSVNDISVIDNFLCISVTDEADFQTIKTERSFRTIPIHNDLLELGFREFVEARKADKGLMLFQIWDHKKKSLEEITPCGRGRFGTSYGKRFSRLCDKLGIDGKRVGTHSYRRAWADLARNAGINPEHRRALSGRDSEAIEAGERVNRVEDKYGHGFSIKVLAESLNKLAPLA